MTVGELISILEDYDEDEKVYIGMYQRYGSDFVMELDNVETENGINSFYGDDKENAIILIEGNQIGSIKSDFDDDDYYVDMR